MCFYRKKYVMEGYHPNYVYHNVMVTIYSSVLLRKGEGPYMCRQLNCVRHFGLHIALIFNLIQHKYSLCLRVKPYLWPICYQFVRFYIQQLPTPNKKIYNNSNGQLFGNFWHKNQFLPPIIKKVTEPDQKIILCQKYWQIRIQHIKWPQKTLVFKK